MCIKAGDNELETVKNLMGMSLKAIVAEALEVDLEEVVESARLREDLHMDERGKAALRALIIEYFDGLEVDIDTMPDFGTLLERVVLSEFHDLAA